MRSFATLAAALVLCGACRERESSTNDKKLEAEIAEAKARQAEAEAEKAAIEARRAGSAHAPDPNRSARSSEDTAAVAVKKLAYEAFAEWAQAHPDKACPDKLEDLAQYMNTRDIHDPWGHPYRMFCGQNLPAGAKGGLAVMSVGPDGQDGTSDDIKSW
jgi:hypothetical protein